MAPESLGFRPFVKCVNSVRLPYPRVLQLPAKALDQCLGPSTVVQPGSAIHRSSSIVVVSQGKEEAFSGKETEETLLAFVVCSHSCA